MMPDSINLKYLLSDEKLNETMKNIKESEINFEKSSSKMKRINELVNSKKIDTISKYDQND